MKTILLFCILSAAGFAADTRPTVLIAYPSANKPTVSKQDLVSIIVEKGSYIVEGTVIPESSVVGYVNGLLKDKSSGVVCLYVRPDLTFGEVFHSVDQLRETNATTVAVSRLALPYNSKL
jgi:hypothetical protein